MEFHYRFSFVMRSGESDIYWNIHSRDLDNEISRAIDGDADWVVTLYYKNLVTKKLKEFQVCDYTCIIGEV